MIQRVSRAAHDLQAAAHEAEALTIEPATLRQRIIRILLWLAVLGIAVLALNLVGVHPLRWLASVISSMGDIEPRYLIAGIALQTANVVLVGLAYVAVWRAAYPGATAIRPMQVATCFAVSIALNSVLPMSIGTWVMLFMFLAIIPGATAAGMASGFGVSKIFFFVAGMLTYAYLFITISGALNEAIGGITNHLPALGAILVAVVVLIVVLLKAFRQKAVDAVKNLKQGAAILRTPRRLVLAVLLPQFAGYCCQIGVTAAFMKGYGIPVSLGNILLNNAANSLATLTAVTPGGVGATQGLTTLALYGTASAQEIAAYSLSQQLVLTLWNCVLAAVLVLIFFGWSGGREIVSNSLVHARTEMKDKRVEGKARKAERKAAKQGAADGADDGTSAS